MFDAISNSTAFYTLNFDQGRLLAIGGYVVLALYTLPSMIVILGYWLSTRHHRGGLLSEGIGEAAEYTIEHPIEREAA